MLLFGTSLWDGEFAAFEHMVEAVLLRALGLDLTPYGVAPVVLVRFESCATYYCRYGNLVMSAGFKLLNVVFMMFLLSASSV